MYFFYFDESGSRDPKVEGRKKGEAAFAKDHLYVLTALSLYEKKWSAFDQEISALKLRLRTKLYREKQIELQSLADCEVKSTSLRLNKSPGKKGYSPFVHNLDDTDKTALSTLFYSQLPKHNMRLFAVVIDKRKLRDHMTGEQMHKKAYELLLERIELYLWEYYPKHGGLIVMDDTQKQLNHAVAMKHAWFQRDGNANLRFKHIIEYPFFTDSRLSNGVQLADLCSYNIYRAFRSEDFTYPYFRKLLPNFYRSRRTREGKLDGLKVFPDDSELIQFAADGYRDVQSRDTEKPAEEAG